MEEGLNETTGELSPVPFPSNVCRSKTLVELFAAMAMAQGEMVNPIKDRKADVKSEKGSYSYAYADLSTIMDVVRPVLSKHGLAIIQFPTVVHRPGSDFVVVTTLLTHKSGEFMSSDLEFKLADFKPQTLGGIISYLRRYAVAPLVGIQAEIDDDANRAQQAAGRPPMRTMANQPPRSPQPVQQPQPPPSAPAPADVQRLPSVTVVPPAKPEPVATRAQPVEPPPPATPTATPGDVMKTAERVGLDRPALYALVAERFNKKVTGLSPAECGQMVRELEARKTALPAADDIFS